MPFALIFRLLRTGSQSQNREGFQLQIAACTGGNQFLFQIQAMHRIVAQLRFRDFLKRPDDELGWRLFCTPAIFPDTAENHLVERFFGSMAGYFVEVGANDPVIHSKTWNLEQKGWTGLLIEPQPEHAERLKATRKSDVCCFACGPASYHGATMPLYIAGIRGIHSSLSENHYVAGSHVTKTINVPVRTQTAYCTSTMHHAPLIFWPSILKALTLTSSRA